jgi:hypothetical protein
MLLKHPTPGAFFIAACWRDFTARSVPIGGHRVLKLRGVAKNV